MSEQQEPIAGAPQGPSPRRPEAPALHMCEVLLDPQMAAGMMTFEGVSFPFIRIAHPRYGVIDCMIPVSSGIPDQSAMNTRMQIPTPKSIGR